MCWALREQNESSHAGTGEWVNLLINAGKRSLADSAFTTPPFSTSCAESLIIGQETVLRDRWHIPADDLIFWWPNFGKRLKSLYAFPPAAWKHHSQIWAYLHQLSLRRVCMFDAHHESCLSLCVYLPLVMWSIQLVDLTVLAISACWEKCSSSSLRIAGFSSSDKSKQSSMSSGLGFESTITFYCVVHKTFQVSKGVRNSVEEGVACKSGDPIKGQKWGGGQSPLEWLVWCPISLLKRLVILLFFRGGVGIANGFQKESGKSQTVTTSRSCLFHGALLQVG